jgi:hypothetical protein
MSRLAGLLGSGMSSLGEGYMKGLILQKQADQTKEELKQHELETQVKIKLLQEETERAKAADERDAARLQLERDTFAAGGPQREALARKTGFEADIEGNKAATILGTGGPPTEDQRVAAGVLQPGKAMDVWQKKVFEMPISDIQKAQLISKFNLDPGTAESQAMKFYLDSDAVPQEEKIKAIKESFGTGGAFGQKTPTPPKLPGAGKEPSEVKDIREIKKNHRKFLGTLSTARIKEGEETPEMVASEYEHYSNYFAELQESGEDIPEDEATVLLNKIGKRWQEEIEETESVGEPGLIGKGFRAVFGGKEQASKEMQVQDITERYHQLIMEIFGEDAGSRVWDYLMKKAGKKIETPPTEESELVPSH